MIPSKKTYEIPLEILEENYWKEAGFCTACKEFFNGKVEPGSVVKCPACGNECFYDADFLIRVGLLIPID